MQRIASLAAVAAATLLASAALAQMTTGVNDAQFETIVAISPDASAMIVQDAVGQQRTVLLNPGTSITRQGNPGMSATTIRVGDISVGDRLVIEGAARQGGFTANRIQVFGQGVVSAPPPGTVVPQQGPATPGAPGANPASPPGTVRPGDPNPSVVPPRGNTANPAQPPSGAGSNPAAPPGGTGGNPAAPPR